MIKLITQAKHWQIFISIFAFPIMLIGFELSSLVSFIDNNEDLSGFEYFKYAKFLPLFIGLLRVLYFIWLLSIINAIITKLPTDKSINSWPFNIMGGLAVGIVISFVTVLFQTFHEKELNVEYLLFMFPLFFIFLIATLYCIHIGAKVLSRFSHEGKKNSYFIIFILLIIYPVGIWFIQPKINKILKNDGATS